MINRVTTVYNGKTQAIFVPGDNDIGGEGSDRVTKEKVKRFNKHFPSQPVYTFRKKSILEVIPVNALTQVGHKDTDVVNEGFPTLVQYGQEDENKPLFRMLVSHLPIMPMQQTLFGQQVLEKLKPSIIFSAHDHRGQNIVARQIKKGVFDANFTIFSQKTLHIFDDDPSTQPGKTDFFSIYIDSHEGKKKYEQHYDSGVNTNTNDGSAFIDNHAILHEIVVPTCSYRMGVKEMAFGIAAINLNSINDKTKDKIELIYANLWLPSRFALLFVYLAALISSAAIFLIGRIQRIRRGRRDLPGSWRSKRRSSSNSPSPHRRSSSRNSYYSKLV